jgi:hypothetical protein
MHQIMLFLHYFWNGKRNPIIKIKNRIMNLRLNVQIILIFISLTLMAFKSSMRIDSSVNTESNSSKSDFEGKIIYSLTFEDKTGAMSKEQAKMFMGEQQIYTIKGNKYKSEMNGMMKMTQYYLGQDTLYNQIGGMNNLFWIDATSNPDELISYNIDKNVETIAGINCDLLTIKTKDGTTKYYFNTLYQLNPENYANHEYGFWKFCIDKTKSLPIKSVIDTKDVYMEIVAKEIKEMRIDDSEFNIPNLPRMKSPDK